MMMNLKKYKIHSWYQWRRIKLVPPFVLCIELEVGYMDYQIVKNRIVTTLDNQERYYKMSQIELLEKAEEGLEVDGTVAHYLNNIQSAITSEPNSTNFMELNEVVSDLLNNLEALEGLKAYHYGLFQSGHSIELLKDYSALDVLTAISPLEFH